ncbi:MAG: hybrid sensor histidine kinase/response regulator [Salinivirgaceae bacterium]|nr:hybrid sensor histidine kinase/response regulator [Salinivirgaceae bacterium]
MDKKQEFLKKMLATFRMEAEENIDALSAYLIELEKNPDESRKSELIEVIYRSAHSLKGASRAVNLSEIESICHSFEDVMSAVKNDEIKFNSQVFDILHKTVNLITELMNQLEVEIDTELSSRVLSHIEDLSMVEVGLEVENISTNNIKEVVVKPENPKPATQNPKPATQNPKPETRNPQPQTPNPKPKTRNPKPQTPKQTIRVSTNKLDNLLFQAEEMLSLKLSGIQRTKNLQKILGKFSVWNKEVLSVLTSTNSIKRLLDKKETGNQISINKKDISEVVQFYEWANSYIKEIEKDVNALRNFTHQEVYTTGAKIETLLEDVKDLITVPMSTLLDVFPKMIRDIAKDLGKEVELIIEGDNIEIDRRILEKLRTPLIHILRNSIDYGIEIPEIRSNSNKNTTGTISLKVEQLENNKIEILISDDGAGIDLKKLKQLYIKNENISDNDIDSITDADCINYIFRSGISTSGIVTDLSGRGLGLAIVLETVEQLNGTIDVETEKGKSTTFRILLPTSIVTFRGILLEVSGREFVVPTSKVSRVLRLHNNEINTIKNKATISFNGEIIPVASLSEILELDKQSNSSGYVHIIVIEIKGKQVGFVIDRFIEEQEVLVKNFNKQLTRIRNISGATVLGSGKVVPVLNISDLFKSSLKSTGTVSRLSDNAKPDELVQQSILVVEDSITSRTLLKNILEAANYKVTTAIDGLEGFTKLKEGNFNAVVSDVEMPRMNGFELTAKIRADKKHAELPVILVTSLSKREDKEKGIDVGASAYIVKSSFDQSNLLEILERLI